MKKWKYFQNNDFHYEAGGLVSEPSHPEQAFPTLTSLSWIT